MTKTDALRQLQALRQRLMPILYCPCCEQKGVTDVHQDSHGVWRHRPCPVMPIWKDRPGQMAEYPVRDIQKYPETEELRAEIERIEELLYNEDPGG